MFENLFFKGTAMSLRSAALIVLVVCLQSGTVSYGQKVSITQKNMPLAEVLKKIRKHTGYNFVFTSDALQKAVPVTLDVKDAGLDKALQLIFSSQPLDYAVQDKFIIVKPRREAPEEEAKSG